MNLITLMQAIASILGAVFVLCVGMIIMSAVYGQGCFRRAHQARSPQGR